MAVIFALEKLYYDVQAQFLADGLDCEQPFGWAKSGGHHVKPRIVWVPGDPAGAAGTITAPKNPGTIPKPLFTFLESFHVIISGFGDAADPVDELKAWKTTRFLFDQWLRAIYLNALGTFQLVRQDWVRAGTRDYVRYGTAMIAVGAIQSAVMDIGPDGAGAQTLLYPAAEIDLHELDYTEHIHVDAHPPPAPPPGPTPSPNP
jgi:hypothetical protein